nr:hypothetical protein [Amycolatopsis saalfeldensis]
MYSTTAVLTSRRGTGCSEQSWRSSTSSIRAESMFGCGPADGCRRPRGRSPAFVPGEQHLGAGIGQIVLDLAGFEHRVDRHDDRARAEQPVIQHDEFRDVRQHQPDALARPDAERPAPGVRPGGPLGQPAVGEGGGFAAHCCRIRITARGFEESAN